MNLELRDYKTSNREQLNKPFMQMFDESANQFKKQLSVSETLDVLFPEQKRQDKNLSRAKDSLGELAKEFTELQLNEIITDIDYLVTGWLDEFEKTLFDGQTLQELLHEKGGML